MHSTAWFPSSRGLASPGGSLQSNACAHHCTTKMYRKKFIWIDERTQLLRIVSSCTSCTYLRWSCERHLRHFFCSSRNTYQPTYSAAK